MQLVNFEIAPSPHRDVGRGPNLVCLPRRTPGSATLLNRYAGGTLETNKPAACHVLEPRPTNTVEDEDDDEYEDDCANTPPPSS
jgi:hypothetical protein